jgi:hypothetical protein
MEPRLDAVEHQTISIENDVFSVDIVECLDCISADFLETEFEKEFKYPLRSLVFFPRNQVKSFLLFHRNSRFNLTFKILRFLGIRWWDL